MFIAKCAINNHQNCVNPLVLFWHGLNRDHGFITIMITTKKNFETSFNKSKLSQVSQNKVTNVSVLTRTSWIDAKTALTQIEKVCINCVICRVRTRIYRVWNLLNNEWVLSIHNWDIKRPLKVHVLFWWFHRAKHLAISQPYGCGPNCSPIFTI